MCLLSELKLKIAKALRLSDSLALQDMLVQPLYTPGYLSLVLAMRRRIEMILKKRAALASFNQVKHLARKNVVKHLYMACLTSSILTVRNKAAALIQASVKGHLTRKKLKTFVKLGKEQAFVFRGQATHVELRAEFTNPPWAVKIPLVYNLQIRAFVSDFLYNHEVAPGKYRFKFISDGEWVCSNTHKREIDSAGNENNCIEIRPAHIKSSIRRRVRSAAQLKDLEVNIRAVSRGKANHGGRNEDAYFTSEAIKLCGVADGVGSWGSCGIDPSLFSNDLMKKCQVISEKYCQKKLSLTAEILREIGRQGHANTTEYGSSTLVLASVVNSHLNYLSVGDSRIAVLRLTNHLYKMVFISKEQQHSFNCPYQLSKLPSRHQFDKLRRSGYGKFISYLERCPEPVGDTTSKGQIGCFTLHKGDLVILGTDGLFDNLFREAIVDIANQAAASRPADLAKEFGDKLLMAAFLASIDPIAETPFEKESKKHGRNYTGGKPDDITAVVMLTL